MSKHRMKVLYLACLIVLGGSILPHVEADPVIYSQPSNFPNGTIIGSQFVATAYDNFTLPIPEPGTMLLIGSGLVGLWGFKRKFRK